MMPLSSFFERARLATQPEGRGGSSGRSAFSVSAASFLWWSRSLGSSRPVRGAARVTAPTHPQWAALTDRDHFGDGYTVTHLGHCIADRLARSPRLLAWAISTDFAVKPGASLARWATAFKAYFPFAVSIVTFQIRVPYIKRIRPNFKPQ
jgi:hypothetical protein